MNVIRRHVLRAVLIVAASVTVGTCAPVLAAAAPATGAAIVTIGDSFTTSTPVFGENAGCARPVTSWPSQLGRLVAAGSIRDVSCNGGALDSGEGWTLVHQVRAAAADGGLGTGTRAIFIQLGLNDTWGASTGRAFPSVDCLVDLVRGCDLNAAAQNRVPDHTAVTGYAYADRSRAAVEYLRYYAPNARIVFVGYPEIFPAGSTSACMNILGNRVTQPRAAGWTTYIDALDRAQRDAAGLLGVEFFDTRSVTAGHGSCTADSWVGGITSVDELSSGAPIHPTPQGNSVVASALSSRYLG